MNSITRFGTIHALLVAFIVFASQDIGGSAAGEVISRAAKVVEKLETFKEVWKQASGVVEDTEAGRRPRQPSAIKLGKAEEALLKAVETIRALRIPPEVDSKDHRFRVSPDDLIAKDSVRRRDALKRLIQYNLAIRANVRSLSELESKLRQVSQTAAETGHVLDKLKEPFKWLATNPVANSLFPEFFGFAYFDLETTVAPLVGELRREAEARAKDTRRAVKSRSEALANHTFNLRELLKDAGMEVPTDIR